MERQLGETVKIVHYKGVDVIYNDLNGLKDGELTERLKENARAMAQTTKTRQDSVIINIFTDTRFDEDGLKYMKKLHKNLHGFFIACAIVGMNGLQKYIVEITEALNSTHFRSKFFDHENEAMDWTVEEYRKLTDLTR